MTEVYLLHNQQGYFLNNQHEWVDGREANRLYRTAYKDEALNTKVELTVKSADLRVTIISCSTTGKGIPQIPESLLPDIVSSQNERFATSTKTELENSGDTTQTAQDHSL